MRGCCDEIDVLFICLQSLVEGFIFGIGWIQIGVMRVCYYETDVIFILLQSVVEGFIFGIGRPRETVGNIDLEMVPAGVCKVTVTTNHEEYT